MHFGNEHGILAFVSDGDDHSLSQNNKWLFVYLKSTDFDRHRLCWMEQIIS